VSYNETLGWHETKLFILNRTVLDVKANTHPRVKSQPVATRRPEEMDSFSQS